MRLKTSRLTLLPCSIVAHCHQENRASVRVLRKLGLEPAGVTPDMVRWELRSERRG